MKKVFLILSTCLLIFLGVSLLVVPASAEEGYYGDMTYYISEGTVTITTCKTSASGKLTIPSKIKGCPVTAIDAKAFSDCDQLTEVVIPESVTVIGRAAFGLCSNLKKMVLPSKIEVIQESAFAKCSKLTSITVPKSAQYIGYNAFGGCVSLQKITLPFLGDGSEETHFSYIFGQADVSAISEQFVPPSLKTVVLLNGCKTISHSAFSNCTSLVSVSIPNSVTTIGWYAFYGCTGLKEIVIPDSVKTIGCSTFSGCSSLEKVTLGKNVQEIGEWAFSNCPLKTIQIGANVKSIGLYAFWPCRSLKSITVDSKNAYYSSEGGVLYDKKKERLICYPQQKTETSYIIPKSVVVIDNYAVHNNLYLKEVIVGNNVKVIYLGAFYECKNLKTVVLGNSVELLEGSVFYNCEKLSQIFIPKTLKNVGHSDFSGCISLEKIWYSGSKEEKNNIVVQNSFGSNNQFIYNNWQYNHKHTYNKVIRKATLTKNGKISYKCMDCGYIASETITINSIKTITLSSSVYTYDSKVKTPTVTVKDSAGKTLKKNTDYTVTYAGGRKNVGTYKVTIAMKGKYTGTKTLTFKINPASINSAKLSSTSYTYNGKAKTPNVTVKNRSGATLTKNASYTVTYATGRKNVGTYKVTVKGKGNYTGTKTLTFKILPVKTTVSKVTAGRKKLTIYVGKKTTQVSGYQIQYSTSKSFSKVKTKTLSSYKTTKATLTGLSAKKTYYVRVRTVKKVNGTNYYSAWSTYKTAKTK